MHSSCPPYLFVKSRCKVLPKDVLWVNTLDYKACSNTWSTCDISNLRLLQKGHEGPGGAWAKGCTLCYAAGWFLPHSGKPLGLSGIPEHHGGDGEDKVGLTKYMQLPVQLHDGQNELAAHRLLQHVLGDISCKA